MIKARKPRPLVVDESNVVKLLIKARDGVVKQGLRCQNGYGTCLYYDHRSGRRCAIGQLFKPTEAAWIEDHKGGLMVYDLADAGIVEAKDSIRGFLARMQEAHDGVFGIDEFIVAANKVINDAKEKFGE